MSTEIREKLTFQELANIVPGLKMLLDEARHYRVRKGYCPIPVWYKDFKPDLVRLVGWDSISTNPAAHTEQAYDLAYSTINAALPPCPKDCRGCD